MFTVIESFGGQFGDPSRGDMPVDAIIEDAFTGLRWLTALPVSVPAGKWRYAVGQGIAGVVVPVPGGMLWASAPVVSDAHQGQPSVEVHESMWQFATSLPSHSDLVKSPEVRGRHFVHLHAHTEFSPLDGLATVQEMVNAAVADNQSAIAVTDHGVCAAHPELARIAGKAGVKPIFGLEANFVNERRVRERVGDYWHLILWAANDRGLQNLWSASTEAHREGFYGRARLDWDTLERHNDGVMCSTACLRGPLSDAILADDEGTVRATLARLRSIFPDRLYVELHTNQLASQHKVNSVLVELAHSFSLPLIVVADSHYACLDDHDAHKVWIAAQTNKTLQDEADLFSGDEHYHVSSAAEVASAIAYLGESVVSEAMANTVTVADRCDAAIVQRRATPTFHRRGVSATDMGEQKDAEVLWEMCRTALGTRLVGKANMAEYEARLADEMALLVSKSFCGYILLVADYCRWAKGNSILMGPGRGSAAGSLVCYLTGITEVDPIEARLLFERFLTPGRTSLPDIDSDFPASKRDEITQYIVNRWGSDRVVRVGTHIRLANRGVMRDVARVLGESAGIDYRDVDAVSKIIEEAEASTSGLGLSWEELWAQHGDVLSPYLTKYPIWFRFAERLVGRLKSYGKHAAGVVIDPDDSIIDRLPLRGGENDQPITEFAMEDLEFLGYVKFDLLTLRTLDSIQQCLDLIRIDPFLSQRVPDIYSWTDEYDDPEVWDMLCDGDTVGVFQIETSSGTRLTKQFHPRSIDDLCAILTLVRPGPMRSGLTDSFLRRRRGDEEATPIHPALEVVLANTHQTMIYQEDIMSVCRTLAGYTMEEADEVRSILGKKKLDKVQAEGQRFVARCCDRGVDRQVAERLWEQMQEFARYAFNRSHSWSYALLAYWTAWLKKHYPAQFLVSVLSTVKKERIPDFVEQARKAGYAVLPPDINESRDGFSVGADRVSVRYGLDSIKGIGAAAMRAIIDHQPYTDFPDFLERRGKACNLGHIQLLASLGVFDSISGTHRASLERWLEQAKSGDLERCEWMDSGTTGPNGLPCRFDWTTEVRIGKSGKPLKPKPVPTRCSKACRNYSKRPDIGWPDVPEYQPSVVRYRERDMLGVFLTSTPFDDVEDDARAKSMTAEALERLPEGGYPVLGLVTRVKPMKDRNGRTMAFVDLLTDSGSVSCVMFSSDYEKFRRDLMDDALVWAGVVKNNRGYQLQRLIPIPQHKERYAPR